MIIVTMGTCRGELTHLQPPNMGGLHPGNVAVPPIIFRPYIVANHLNILFSVGTAIIVHC
jgi:hypothetical protein